MRRHVPKSAKVANSPSWLTKAAKQGTFLLTEDLFVGKENVASKMWFRRKGKLVRRSLRIEVYRHPLFYFFIIIS